MDAIQPPPLACSAAAAVAEEAAARDLDIVILVSKSSLPRLDAWRGVLKRYHLLIVIEDDLDRDQIKQQLDGLDFDLYSAADAANELARSGANSSLAASRSFALLASRRKYLAFLDIHAALPAADPATKKPVDPFQQHLTNLRSPSTPFFFNTLYDPFRPGADFVRGYPFSLRTGVATAVSHGLWLEEKSSKPVVDAVLTVPMDAFFAMRSVNVAFDRELVGAAMFLGCGDVWAGLCAKRICDHLRVGVKSGLPYVVSSASDPENGEMEMADCSVVDFLRAVELPEGESASAVECYAEIVRKIKADKPKFAEGISVPGLEAWIGAWKEKESKSC